jgi:hypothetical protein
MARGDEGRRSVVASSASDRGAETESADAGSQTGVGDSLDWGCELAQNRLRFVDGYEWAAVRAIIRLSNKYRWQKDSAK